MSLLDSVITERKPKPPIVLLYGTSGIGKTTFGVGSPSPIFMQTEDGLGDMDCPAFPLFRNYGIFYNALCELCEAEHPYKTLVIDSLDHLEPLIWKAVCQAENKPNIEAFGYGKGYNMAQDIWVGFWDAVIRLRDEKNMAVICLAHGEVKHINDPESDGWDQHTPKLHKHATSLAKEKADCVLFANYCSHIIEGNNGKTRAAGNGDRMLYTEERPAYVAKNRWSLPHQIPLSFEAFTAALREARNNKEKSA